MRFNIIFQGRKVGAIGAFSTFFEVVIAKDENAAIKKLYENYEHIRVLKII